MVNSPSPIQQALNKKNPRQRDVMTKGMSPDELLQENPLVSKDIEDTKNNQIYQNIKFFTQLTRKFKIGIAILYVEAEGEKYRVKGRSAIQGQLNTQLTEPPEVSFAYQMQGKDISTKMRQITGRMRQFSQKKLEAREIRGWLFKLEEKLGKNFNQNISCLIINDSTDFEIPWEMLELTENRYLGASIVTTRWQAIIKPYSYGEVDNLIPLEIESDECCGDIVAYANTKDLKNVEQEVKILNRFNTKSFERIDNFLEHLEQVNSQISLVFIASHGFLGENITQISFGEVDLNNQFSLAEMYDYDFEFFKNSNTIIFMNTCHSGRLIKDQEIHIIDQDERTGFATFFLERGAKGVVGTLSQVADKYAAKVTDNFFTEHQKDPTLPVAAILRNMRAQAAKNLQISKTRENKLMFLVTFMYIYYGNPEIVLQPNLRGE